MPELWCNVEGLKTIEDRDGKNGGFWNGEYRLIHIGTSKENPKVGGVGIMLSKILGKILKDLCNTIKELF